MEATKEKNREKFTTTLKVGTRKDLEKIKADMRVRGVNDVIEFLTELYIGGTNNENKVCEK